MKKHTVTTGLMLLLIALNAMDVVREGFNFDKLSIILLAINIIIYSYNESETEGGR